MLPIADRGLRHLGDQRLGVAQQQMHAGPHSAWWPPIGWPVTSNGRWGVSDNQRQGMRQAVTLCGNRGFTSRRRKEPRH